MTKTQRSSFFRDPTSQRAIWIVLILYVLSIYLTLPVMRSILNWIRQLISHGQLGFIINLLLGLAGGGLILIAGRKNIRVVLWMIPPILLTGVWISQLDIPEERVHFLQYGLVGILTWKTQRGKTWQNVVWALVIATGIGALDELIQWFLPNRVGDWRDVWINTAAGGLGIWSGYFLFSE
ncbi:MAG: VanZ family protein [SAR324 cluster bacterium]|nr:VanZ family protein [SAR324 cluster bacterium]